MPNKRKREKEELNELAKKLEVRENIIKNENSPLYVGMDHDGADLNIIAKTLIEKYGQEGKTLFIEGRPYSGLYRLAERLFAALAGLNAPFLVARKKAKAKGMEIVLLDKRSEEKLARGSDTSRTYRIYQLREKHWKSVLRRRAKSGDIVLMHPNHLRRIILGLQPTKNKNIFYATKTNKDLLKPLSLAEVIALKRERSKERAKRRRKLPPREKRRLQRKKELWHATKERTKKLVKPLIPRRKRPRAA